MKRFLRFIAVIILFSLIIFLSIINFGNWSSDNFYYKVSSSKKESMIIGSSRALQGLNPDVLNQNLNRYDIYNFAFTNLHSPYGLQYYNSINNKLNKSKNDNIFFISVQPWTISSKIKNANNEQKFRELKSNLLTEDYKNGLIGKLKYYYAQYNNRLFGLIYNFRKTTELNENGYLKLNLRIDPSRIERKAKHYLDNMLPNYQYSKTRYDYLVNTIRLLKDYGVVYLIRLPVHEKIYQIDNKLIKNFDDLMVSLSRELNLSYINLSLYNNEYSYTDGNHLDYESAEKVSKRIANVIKNLNL